MTDDTNHSLEKHRLGKYAQGSAGNEIDLGVLAQLSERDLEQIGQQLIGCAFDEETFFKVAKVLEQAAGLEALPQFIAEAA